MARGCSSGKPWAERSTIPVSSVHMKGAEVKGNPNDVDQPTTRPRLSMPTASDAVVPGRVPRSMA
jgi:hypothetical protein